jgi:hypothetical protein
MFCADADDLLYLPAGCQPWGAAARVADVGGYSPSASSFDSTRVSASGLTLDSYSKAVTANADSTWRSISTASLRSADGRMRYFEFLLEETGRYLVGAVQQGASLSSYPGINTTSWGYYPVDGNTYYNGTTVATGVTGTAVEDRLGVLWDGGAKIWFVKNGTVIGGGDPEAGTGAHHTNVSGNLYPHVGLNGSIGQARVRICTHAREQLYRPAYAEAWDGADILPEQHYTARLGAAPTVRRSVSYVPWAGGGSRGAPIGSIDIDNADGVYDEVIDSDIRDEDCVAYRLDDAWIARREWAGIIDSVQTPSASALRVFVASYFTKLAIRVDSPVFAVGNPELVPGVSRQGSTITRDVSQLTANAFSVYDQGVVVSSWARADTADYSGFTRTVNPAGLQSVRELNVLRTIAAISISNNDFASWTGSPETPTNWTVLEKFGGNVYRNGDSCVLSTNNPGDSAAVWHAYSFVSGKRYAFRVNIDAFTSPLSDLEVIIKLGSAPTGLPVLNNNYASLFYYQGEAPATGEHVVFIDCVSNATGFAIHLYQSTGVSSVSIDDVTVFEADETYTPSKAFSYLIEDIGGQASTFWEYSSPLSPYSPGRVGHWTDDRPTIDSMVYEILDSLLCDVYQDSDGVTKLAWLTPPDEVTSASDLWLGEVAESEVFGDLTVEDDLAPNLSTRAEYQRNYIQHSDGDIAGSVSNADRQYFTSERKENQLFITGAGSPASEAGNLHPFYVFAEEAPAMPRVLVNDFTTEDTPSDGSTTVDNRLILLHRCYAVRRRFYSFAISRNKSDALGVHPGGVLELTHARYGLSGGKNLMIVSVETNLTSPTTYLTCWG